MNRIQLGAWMADGWFLEKLGRGRPNPVTTSVADVARYEQDRARVKALVWEFAEALGFHNMRILVLFSCVDAQVKRNLDAFFEAGREVNAEAGRRHAKP